MQGRRDARAQWHASDYQSCGVAGLVDVLSVYSFSNFQVLPQEGSEFNWTIFKLDNIQLLSQQGNELVDGSNAVTSSSQLSVTNLMKIHLWLKFQSNVDEMELEELGALLHAVTQGPRPFLSSGSSVPSGLQVLCIWLATNEERMCEGSLDVSYLHPIVARDFHSCVNGECCSRGITFIQGR